MAAKEKQNVMYVDGERSRFVLNRRKLISEVYLRIGRATLRILSTTKSGHLLFQITYVETQTARVSFRRHGNLTQIEANSFN
jgi:hypothetical protein